jgi:flavin reductase (DIM6/NTAB) family NADH-FMN oxidoreductase RutF
VSIADEKNMIPADYVGIVSGNEVADKMEKSGFHTVKSAFVDAPLIEELPFVLECKLESFDADTAVMIGEIVNVAVDENILNEQGNIDLAKFSPLTYDPDNHTYVKLGEQVGIAYQEGLKIK